MEIKRPAIAGTLESSDCQVMVEAGEGKIDLSLDSAVINQYGNQIRKVVLETLENLLRYDADPDQHRRRIRSRGCTHCNCYGCMP